MAIPTHVNTSIHMTRTYKIDIDFPPPKTYIYTISFASPVDIPNFGGLFGTSLLLRRHV